MSLAFAPAAGAENAVPVAVDPVAMAVSIVDASLAGLPAMPPAAALPPEVPAAPVPEAVAAAAEPIPAQEPQPTPPPPQPQGPDPHTAPEELAPPPDPAPPAAAPAPEPVEQPQYQSEPPQYQPTEEVATPEITPEPAATPEEEWSWDWEWSCGDSQAPKQLPTVENDGLPDTWNWNWVWNCDPATSATPNNNSKSSAQYQPVIAQYRPVNINVSIRIASPGDNGPVTQTNVVVAVEAPPVAVAVQAPIAAPVPPPSAPPAPPPSAAPEQDAGAAEAAGSPAAERSGRSSGPSSRAGARPTFAAAERFAAPVEAPSWTARPIPPRRLQPTKTEGHSTRPKLRRPTRRPLPPLRAPTIPVSAAGAAPLGGADGGGFQVALLLVPFALALVDSARRLVRDTPPPVGRGHKKRRKRPG